ncbi:Ig-like domain-containing protein [Yoonia sp. GPGPB17]|uniref:cadherin domain-containing protein n=1 Tax=Yoonia sp. GPGPB17 TaxID=3026147 RepID=UPI0030C60B21
MTITITGINDSPDVIDVALGTIAEDAGVQSVRLADFTSDSDGDAIQFNLLDTLPTGVTWDGEFLRFDPDAIADTAGLSTNETQSITLDATATDDAGNTSDPFSVGITISGIDDPAIVPDRSFEVLEGETVLMNLFGTITDIDDDAIGLGWGPLGSTVPTLDPFELSGVLGVGGGDLAYAAIDPSTLGPNPIGVIGSDSFDPLAENETRTVSFTYFGGQPGSPVAGDVTITITGVNDAPDIADTALGTFAEDAGVQSIRLSDLANDLDGDAIQINLLDALPTGVSWDGDILRIDPDTFADAAGLGNGAEETITLRATASDDLGNTSDVADLGFTVTGIDDPAVVPDQSFAVFEGETVFMDLFAGIVDVDDPAGGLGWGPLGTTSPSLDPFTLSGVLGVAGGAFGYLAADPSTLGPNPIGVIASDDFGPLAEGAARIVSFTYFGGQPGAFASGDVTITVTGVNDAPDIADIVLGSFSEDAGVQRIALADFANDLDGDAIQINLLDALPTGVTWDGDVLQIDPDAFADDAGLSAGEEETVTLTLTASDAVGNTSETVSLDFTVTGIDDPLIVPDLTFEVLEGDTVLMDLFAAITDVDDDAVGLGWGPLGSVTPSLDPLTLTGVLGLTGGVFGYAAVDPSTLGPNPIGVIASDSFGPLAEDETRIVSFTYFGGQPGDFAAGDVTITVTGVNDAPVFTSAATVSVMEGMTTLIDVNAIDDAAVELDGLTYALESGGDSALFSIDAATGQLSFAAPPDFEAPGDGNTDNIYTVNVVASDGSLSTTQTLIVSVEPDLTPVTLTVVPGVTTLTGNGGADILLGAIGANTLNGAGGNDTVGAPAGQNVIVGSAGDDLLQGGINDDVLLGGAKQRCDQRRSW